MKKKRYPKKGDIVWCALDPIKGHEQAGTRPCVVISGTLFNQKTGTAVVCPITSTVRTDYYFRVHIDTGSVGGFIMVDQIRTVDWKERVRRIEGAVDTATLREVYARLAVLFDTA